MYDLPAPHPEARALLEGALATGDSTFFGLFDTAVEIFDLDDEAAIGIDGMDLHRRIGGKWLSVIVSQAGLAVAQTIPFNGRSNDAVYSDVVLDASFIPVGAKSVGDIVPLAVVILSDLHLGLQLLVGCRMLQEADPVGRKFRKIYSELMEDIEARTINLGLWHQAGMEIAADDCRTWLEGWLSGRIGLPSSSDFAPAKAA